MTKFFKYFSLVSFSGSAIVYCMPLDNVGFRLEYFLVLHLTSMVAFASMLWSLHKRRKVSITSSNAIDSMKDRYDYFLILFKGKTGHVLALSVCSVLILIFMQFHIQNFMSSVGAHTESSDVSSFIESGSGHWIIFSAIPTIYYFFVIPLLEDWSRIKSG